jgi:hypothetical protein
MAFLIASAPLRFIHTPRFYAPFLLVSTVLTHATIPFRPRFGWRWKK